MDLEMRKLMHDEIEALVYADARAFGDDFGAVEPYLHLLAPSVETERSLVVFDEGEIAGSVQVHSYEILVPGGTLPLGGIASAFVLPTHRRRGLLREMMDSQLRDIHEREEPLSALGASESIIYGRFGYGIGVFSERWSIDRHHTSFARPHERRGRTRYVEPDEMKTIFPDVYRRATANRPGVIQRPEWDWNRVP